MTASPPCRVFVDHGEAYGNLGDEAMLLSALSRLEQHLGPCVFVLPREGDRPLPALQRFAIDYVPSPFAFFLRAEQRLARCWPRLVRLGFPVVPGFEWKVRAARFLARAAALGLERDGGELLPAIAALRGCDAFYGVGAADFNDLNGRGAAYKTWLYRLARRHVRVMAVSAQGFGPVADPELLRLMRWGFGALDLLSFRDCAYSAQLTRELGPLPCATQIVGDEAFGLEASAPAARDAYLQSAGLRPGEPFIAVHWRSTDYVQETEQFYPAVARIFEDASRASESRLVFFPMSYDLHSRHDDDCGVALRRHMSSPERLLMAPKTHDVGLIKGAIGASRFTLGLSYHVHVFGLSQSVPALAVYTGDYYRYKSDGLVGFYGAPNASIDVAAAPGESAAKQALRRLLPVIEKARDNITRCNENIGAANSWTVLELARRLGRGPTSG